MRKLTIPIGPQGAILQVEIGVSAPRRSAILRVGMTPPAAIQAAMLVDTGASHTFIGTTALESLSLTPRDSYRFHSASTDEGEPDECDEYDVCLTLGSSADQNLWRFSTFRIMASDRLGRHRHGLLGRDVLEHMQMEWNGTQRLLHLLYP